MPPGGLASRDLPRDVPGAVASPDPGELRASDADRNETVNALREEFASGRLSHDTFLYRMNAAMEARYIGELPPLLDGLPPVPSPRPGVLGRLKSGFRRLARRGAEAVAATPTGAAPAPPGRAAPPGGAAQRLTGALRLSGPASSRPGAAPPPPLPFPRTEEGFFTIGRDARCDLAIEDMTVSRIHARLERAPDGWLLKDLSSTNGTRLNGWRVRSQVKVRPGDVVRFGDVEYILTEDARG